MVASVSHSAMAAQVVSLPSSDQVPTSSSNNGLGGAQSAILNENNFFQLLTAQLENQDPLNTMSASDFAAELAQFSTAIGVQSMSATQSAYGNLQLSSMVGQKVAVQGNALILNQGTPATGAFSLSGAASDVIVTVSDNSGNQLATLDLGAMAAGTQNFSWGGVETGGATAPPGNYQFSVMAAGTSSSGVVTATPYAVVPVTGVSLGGQNGPMIDVGGGLPAVGLGGIYQLF
jgi:flagellar basal-body rod modification protein FlgD